MEIKDNTLLRQFEISTSNGLVTIEYSLQDRKIFLTKFCKNENEDEDLHDEFIETILQQSADRKLKVVPTHSRIVKFFRKHKKYKNLLPPGIRI